MKITLWLVSTHSIESRIKVSDPKPQIYQLNFQKGKGGKEEMKKLGIKKGKRIDVLKPLLISPATKIVLVCHRYRRTRAKLDRRNL